MFALLVSACEKKDSTPPGAVSDLTATVGDGQVALSWTEPADADLAEIEIAQTPSDKIISQPSGLNGISILGLTNGTSYNFSVLAVDEDGNRSNASQILAVPNTPFVLADPDPNDYEPTVIVNHTLGYQTTASSETFGVDLMGYLYISLTFNRPLDINTVQSAQTIYFEGESISPGSIAFSNENKTITFTATEQYHSFVTGGGGYVYMIYDFSFVLIGDDAGNGVIQDSNGMALDGDADGIPGGDFVLGLSIWEQMN